MNNNHFNNFRLLHPPLSTSATRILFSNDHYRQRPSRDNLQIDAPNSNVSHKSTSSNVLHSIFILLYALLISFPVRHTDNFRFDWRHCIGDLMAHTNVPWFGNFCTVNVTDKVLFTWKPKFQKKATNFSFKTIHKNSFFFAILLQFFILVLGFPIDIFVDGYIEIPLISHCMAILPVNER